MQKKHYLFIGFGALLVLVGFVVMLNISGTKEPAQPGRQPSLPDYVLSADEESRIRQFVQNFVSLYNSYSTEDISNVQALEDYETPALQLATDRWVAETGERLPAGFSLRTESLPDTFAYTYPSAQNVRVTMQAVVSKIESYNKETKQTYTASLSLQKIGQRWLVDEIYLSPIKKQP